jgi:hypothetical protein
VVAPLANGRLESALSSFRPVGIYLVSLLRILCSFVGGKNQRDHQQVDSIQRGQRKLALLCALDRT